MRFFSSWWQRVPGREVASTLLTALAVIGALGHAGAFVRAFLGPYGFNWG